MPKQPIYSPDTNYITSIVKSALSEDIGAGDVTALLIPTDSRSTATVITREDMVLSGVPWFTEVFHQLEPNIQITWKTQDGDCIPANQSLCHLEGPSRALLTGERTALNFLQTLSGTATTVKQYAQLLEGTETRLLDTRKTIPGLRLAQKYAVRCGGGYNHRIGLYDGILIKENHILACGSITNAVHNIRKIRADLPLEVEVENLAELEEALQAKADIALLDNFSIAMMREAVLWVDHRIKLEASGNIDLSNIRLVAETGVDFISVGSLTKHIRAIDLSMRFAAQ